MTDSDEVLREDERAPGVSERGDDAPRDVDPEDDHVDEIRTDDGT